MKRILTFTALFLFAAMANAQAKNNASVKYAPTAPSGVAPVNVLPIQVYQGNIYVYNSSTSDWYCSTCGGGTVTNALTAAATGGAAPGSTFNGSAAVTFDYHSFGAQVNLSLIKGTLTDGDMCTYTAAGTLLNCNTAVPSGSGTVNSGTAGQIAHYGATGTAVSGTNALDNGTTATTQAASDTTSAKVATQASITAALAAGTLPGSFTSLAASTGVATGGASVPSLPSGAAGCDFLFGGANYTGLCAPTTLSQNLTLLVPNANPAGSVLQFPAPTGGVSQGVWVTIPTALPPNGSASGDLSGSYPNPNVAKLNGNTPGGTCTNQVATAIDSSGRPTCNAVSLAAHATQAADTVAMNATGGSAAPTAVAMPTCTTGADLYNTSTHTWSCVSTGGGAALPFCVLSYTSGATGGNNVSFTGGSANTTTLYGLTNAVACSVSKIEFQIGTADATNSYDIGIYNSSGTLLANVGAAVYSAIGDVVKSFAQGTVTIPAGIVFLGTTGNATTAQIRYQVNNQYECPPNNTTGGTTSGGALNSSLTIAANVACIASAIPGVVIRN